MIRSQSKGQLKTRYQGRKQKGFTLIEMILAVAIFALVSAAAIQILTTVLDADENSQLAIDQLYGMERAFFWIERDFLQVTKRQFRIDGEKATDKVFIGGDLIMESEGSAVMFNHDGWRNPSMILPRSEIQTVSYRMFEGNLERAYFNYPDPVTGEEPRVQILLTGVKSLTFEFFSEQGWGNVWDQSGLPSAVKVIIETETIGEVERWFKLAGATASGAKGSGMGLSRDSGR